MKKLVLLAIVAVVLGYTAKAQDAEEFRENWQKTITVPASQATTIEKLFTAWGKQFPGQYVDAFNKFKKTGKANKIEVYENFFRDFKVDLAPRNGYIEISTADTMIAQVDANFRKGDTIVRKHILNAAYWNLPSGNKLFGISIEDDGEIFAECALAFYEYDVNKGTLSPSPKMVQKVMAIVNDDPETFIILPKEGRDLKYLDFNPHGDITYKTIKWKGKGF